jgi:hypothetical protein
VTDYSIRPGGPQLFAQRTPVREPNSALPGAPQRSSLIARLFALQTVAWTAHFESFFLPGLRSLDMGDLNVRNVLILAAIGLVSGAVGGILVEGSHAGVAGSSKLVSDQQLQQDDWLLGASDDAERFRRLQQQLRGFDQPMWEIGERFTRIHDALGRGNYELAVFHWWKIEQTLRNAAMKRPKRAANAEAFFLNGNYQRLRTEFESRDPRRAWAAFEEAKGICQACHHAEQSGFANDQALFELSAPAGYARADNKQ